MYVNNISPNSYDITAKYSYFADIPTDAQPKRNHRIRSPKEVSGRIWIYITSLPRERLIKLYVFAPPLKASTHPIVCRQSRIDALPSKDCLSQWVTYSIFDIIGGADVISISWQPNTRCKNRKTHDRTDHGSSKALYRRAHSVHFSHLVMQHNVC